MLATAARGCVIFAALAAAYVYGQLGRSGLEGYEKEWRWQLAFFSLTQLPPLLVLLGVVLVAEWVLLRSPRSDEDHRDE